MIFLLVFTIAEEKREKKRDKSKSSAFNQKSQRWVLRFLLFFSQDTNAYSKKEQSPCANGSVRLFPCFAVGSGVLKLKFRCLAVPTLAGDGREEDEEDEEDEDEVYTLQSLLRSSWFCRRLSMSGTKERRSTSSPSTQHNPW
jgi:hypothetical protein